MMDGRCETCKWWDRLEGDAMGDCDRIDLAPQRERPLSDDPYIFRAPAGEGIWLTTPASFGCVLYEPKDTNAESD